MKTLIPEWLMPRLKFKKPKDEDAAEFPPLEKICYKDHPCSDCGKELSQQRIIEIRRCNKPYPHWQQCCKACSKYQNPVTKEYNLTNYQLRVNFYPPNAKKDKY